LLLSLGIGLLVGFEREWSHKDLGARTFAIISLFGMFAALIGPAFIVAALAGVVALIVVVNIAALKTDSQPENHHFRGVSCNVRARRAHRSGTRVHAHRIGSRHDTVAGP
jgi:uncharacterized membrane protein YhiD involved in acid resistance